MKALLLAAGEGTRLGELTRERPKAMVELAGAPMVAYSLRWLRVNGVRQVAINLHHRPEPLREYVGDGSRFGVEVTYSYEPELLGTAGALDPLREFFADEREFLVLYGDVLTDLQLAPVLTAHRAAAADVTLVLKPLGSLDPSTTGVVELEEDDGGRVTGFVEKPDPAEVTSGWANAGIYVCGPAIWDYLPEGFCDFARDLLPAMIRGGAKLRGVPADGTVTDMGMPGRLARAEALVRAGAFGKPET